MKMAHRLDDEPILWRDDFVDHPVIGFYADAPKAHDRNRYAQSPFIAWLDLNAAIFVEVVMLDPDAERPLILRLRTPPCMVCDVSRAWNWRPRDASRFVSDLNECGFLEDELAAVMLSRIGRSREKRAPIQRQTKAAILSKTGGRCVYCGVKLTTKRDQPNSYHADHVLSVRDGATDDPALLAPACARCNGKKGKKTLAEFIAAERESQS